MDGAEAVLTVVLEPEAERRVLERARDSGMSEAAFVRMLIERSLDDLDDIQIALDRLDAPLPTLTSAQARERLGLDD